MPSRRENKSLTGAEGLTEWGNVVVVGTETTL